MGPRRRPLHQGEGLVHLLAPVAHEGGSLNPAAPRSCPACARGGPFSFVETWRDPVAGGAYELWSCGPCGLVFSEPRRPVDSGWYEKAAPLRARETGSSSAGDWRFSAFLAEGLPPGTILDVGCGGGAFLAAARKNGWTGVGFDYERRMVDVARARGVEAHAADFSSFCRSRVPGEFDAVALFDVLEHTPEPAELLGLVKPLLKTGGHLVLTLPNARRPVPFGREEYDYPPHHFTRWTPETMKGFLERGGFAVVRQDAAALATSYLCDQFYFNVLMPAVLRLAKRALFGRTDGGKTVSQLYEEAAGAGGWLADKPRRQALVDAGKAVFRLAAWPAAAAMVAAYRLTRPLCGNHLYTLARRAA